MMEGIRGDNVRPEGSSFFREKVRKSIENNVANSIKIVPIKVLK